MQNLQVSAEGLSYQVSLDVDLDLDNDGTPDLGVATGKGRSGDGMHYWRYDRTLNRFLDAGEAPRLARSAGGRPGLWALVSGIGSVQATRMDYELAKNGVLVERQAIRFEPDSANTYRLTTLEYRDEDGTWNAAHVSTGVDQEAAQVCMSGGPCPMEGPGVFTSR